MTTIYYDSETNELVDVDSIYTEAVYNTLTHDNALKGREDVKASYQSARLGASGTTYTYNDGQSSYSGYISLAGLVDSAGGALDTYFVSYDYNSKDSTLTLSGVTTDTVGTGYTGDLITITDTTLITDIKNSERTEKAK